MNFEHKIVKSMPALINSLPFSLRTSSMIRIDSSFLANWTCLVFIISEIHSVNQCPHIFGFLSWSTLLANPSVMGR